jgi:hypothetical protein
MGAAWLLVERHHPHHSSMNNLNNACGCLHCTPVLLQTAEAPVLQARSTTPHAWSTMHVAGILTAGCKAGAHAHCNEQWVARLSALRGSHAQCCCCSIHTTKAASMPLPAMQPAACILPSSFLAFCPVTMAQLHCYCLGGCYNSAPCMLPAQKLWRLPAQHAEHPGGLVRLCHNGTSTRPPCCIADLWLVRQ